MKKNSYITTVIFLLFSLFSSLFWRGTGSEIFAQGETNFWYFGLNAGLDFSGGAPVAVTNGQINTNEGCASVSDAAGNLLFYTEGTTVWNSNHVQMPNGFGLLGHFSSTQSSIIIQKPGSATIYYIFTVDFEGGTNGIRYSEVDMTLNTGLGDVTANKNILLNTPSCEKITGIRHCNNTDVWMVTHDWNSNTFRTYLVTSVGVNTIPIVSNAGLIVNGNSVNKAGQLKGSPDGKKLASAIRDPINRFELFDFDNSTGIVSNAILFPQFSGNAYGVEFSPDGTKMYGSTFSPGNIYQFDLCAGSNPAIANSGMLIGTPASWAAGSLQLGPDKKIYVARTSVSWVGVINNPNTVGAGCNYVDNGISLAGKNGFLGLPNFISFKQPPPPFTMIDSCLNGTFTPPMVNITNCSGSTSAITSVSWNFGDPVSGVNNTSIINNPTHTFTNAGTYTVTLVLNYACGNDTIIQNITVVNCGITTTISSTAILCNGQCTGIATANPTGGATPYTYLWLPSGQTTQTVTGLCMGTYTAIITDASTATATAAVNITQPAMLTITVTSTPSTCVSNNGTSSVTAGGGTTGYTYSWIPSGQTSQTATNLATGNYTATVTDANGCTTTQTVTVVSSGTITTSQSTSICQGSTYTLPGGTVVSTGGVYIDTLASTGGCDSVITTTLTVNSNPTAAAFSSTTIAQGQNATLAASGGGTYSWSNGSNGSSITVTPPVTTLYCVTVTDPPAQAGANGCTDTACVTVTIEQIDCSIAGELFLPNAFSPNGDEENDLLQIYYGNVLCIKTLHLVIYDRWGEAVFETTNVSDAWDGKYKGKTMHTEVLVYYLNVTMIDGKEIIRKGNVSLMR